MDVEITEELRLAVEVVRAAYQEAMTKHGLPPATVELIHTSAEEDLAALGGKEHSLDPSVRVEGTAPS